MQVNSTTYVAPTPTSSQTQNTEEISEKKFDTSKPFDIDSFTFEDYKAIDEQELGDWIKDSELPNENEVENKVAQLTSMVSLTEDDTFNKVMFDKVNESYNTGESLFRTVLVPLADMRDGGVGVKEENLELMNPAVAEAFKNDPKNQTTSLSGGGERKEAFTFKVEDILSLMKGFSKFYNNLDSESKNLMGDVSDTNKAIDEIVIEYTKRKDEENAILDAYTKNNKQVPNLG